MNKLFNKSRVEELNQQIESGREVAAKSDLIIAGIVRNAEQNLPGNIARIRTLAHAFKSLKVVVFENDSDDRTVSILEKWAKNNSDVILDTRELNIQTIPNHDNEGNRFYSQHRIQHMANFRNQYLDYIASNKMKADYLMVLDFDIPAFYMDGIFQSLGMTENWDALFANGMRKVSRIKGLFKSQIYFDTFAYRAINDEEPQNITKIQSNQYLLRHLSKLGPLHPVKSAFGGLGIYKFESIMPFRYKQLDNDNEEVRSVTEHEGLHIEMIQAGKGKLFINPKLLVSYS